MLFLPNFHVHSKTTKRASKYLMSINQCFEEVLNACSEQHGSRCWLYRPLRNALLDLHSGRARLPDSCPVSVHSIELWSSDGSRLVAGEIGYRVGSTYTSMTGFYRESGCGSIQLAALAGLLVKSNISVWDLGMCMDYKLDLGASLIERSEWIRILRDHRQDKRMIECPPGTDAGDLVSHLTRIHSQ